MEAEAVPVFLGRKAVVKNAGEVSRINPDTIVTDGDLYPVG
jgi:hypothetical protein